ncbi:cytoskeletal protein Sojo, partial [Osmerus eperlanus]|uniref:cytoskeletal protein Sojo n=1 Tax=Osmerus eperlanus TaxID=29151 RepID=UPI002E0D8AE3
MSACGGELSSLEQEVLSLRRESNSRASQLSLAQNSLQHTQTLLDTKSCLVVELEEKLQRSEEDRRNSSQLAQLLEGQLQGVRGELTDTLGHLQELRDLLLKTQVTCDERQASLEKLASEL